jgi:glutaredoxin
MSSKSKYYFYAILLKGCPYSTSASELLNNNNIKNKVEIINSKNKGKFKLENYNTFPQIFLKRDNSNESLFLGGYSDLNEFFKIFKNKKYNENNIIQFQNKYNWWSKKAILRSIELINNF